MTLLVRLKHVVFTAALCVLALPTYGQSRIIDLDGHAVHVYTAGWEHAAAGQPIVVFESGSTLPIEVWEPVLASIAEGAPVVAFDPPGVGQSEWDGARPTLEHMNTKLHRLLNEMEAAPPYVLVGHSWAGWLVRGFAGRYADEVAGLVLVDPTPPHAASVAAFEEIGAGEEAQGEFNRLMEGLMREVPPPMRAQQEVIAAYGEAATDPVVPATPSVPVVVILGGTYGDPPVPEALRPSFDVKAFLDALKGRQIVSAVEWVRALPDGTLVLAAQNGHCVQCEDPELVAWAVRRVLSLAQAEQQGR
jgi:pimeloyl-ACP methyl ester carboxylesterase